VKNSPSALQLLEVVYGLLWCGSLARLGPLVPLQMIPVTFFFPFERWVGNRVVCSCLPERWPWVVCRVADFHLLSILTQ